MMTQKQKFSARALASVSTIFALWAPIVSAQDNPSIGIEYIERQNVDERAQALGIGLLGDQIDLNTGTLSFEHVDVSLPGNSDLEVAIRRKLKQGFPFAHIDATTYAGSVDERTLTNGFSDWELDVPNISIVYPAENSAQTGPALCQQDNFGLAVHIFESTTPIGGDDNQTLDGPLVTVLSSYAVSNGLDLNIPGRGATKIFSTAGSSATWPVGTIKATKDYWALRCAVNDQGGDGFIATAPNGNQYYFDKLAYRAETGIPVEAYEPVNIPDGEDPGEDMLFSTDGRVRIRTGALGRTKVTLLVTKVTDVHGNQVDYTYDFRNRLVGIQANDGRQIAITRQSATGLITSVSANNRTWQYDYQEINGNTYLHHVILPDSRSWIFNNMVSMILTGGDEVGCAPDEGDITLTHPDGVVGTFSVRNTRHLMGGRETTGCGRTNVERFTPNWFETASVISKTLSGPGYPAATWEYTYSGGVDDGSDDIVVASDGLKWGEVKDPVGNRMRSYYVPGLGSSGGAPGGFSKPLEGLMMRSEYYSASGALVREVVNEYSVEAALGTTWLDNEAREKFTSPRPMTRTVETIDGETYTTDYTYNSNQGQATYSFSNPIEQEQFSTLQAGARDTVTTYEHNLTKWIVGLPKTITRNGTLFSEYEYNTNGQLIERKSFGVTDALITYHTSGVQAGRMARVTDAIGREIELDNWHRGVPRRVTRPDDVELTRTVDDNGWLLSQTDALLRTTAYDYNDAGRLTLIDRPGTFASTVVDWATIASGTRQTITTGAQRIIVNYDGMLRPYVTETRDLTNVADTVCDHALFDALNRETYTVTHPVSAATSQCLTAVQIATEFANATPYAITTTEYLTDNRTRVTDAEGHATTTTASGYGAPDDGNPVLIAQPEGVSTAMTYDIFGNLLSATQGGGGVSQTQSWVYDARLRLCRHTTPETGSTLYEYNNANQLIGMANGQGTGTNCAALPAADRITNQYDSLGRLDLVDYAGSTPDVDPEYNLTGTLESVTRGSSTWTYTYNELDAPTSETLTIDGRTYQLNYGYDTNGYMASSTLPDGRNVAYAPDGFGRPTRASIGGVDHASGVTYDIYGALTELTYGNGATLREGRNARNQSIWRDVVTGNRTAISYTYDHDLNGRITSILDGKTAGFNRAFAYDGIGRLTTANGQWGNGTFAYDALGNITAKTLGSRTVGIEYAANNRVSRARDSATGNIWKTYGHDARGNVTSNADLSFVYDLSNQPVSMSGDASGTYAYDGNYKRVKQTIDGETIYTMYNLAGEVAYRDNVTTGEVTSYARLGGRTVARFKGAEVAYLHADHLGSPVAATDETGAILWAEHFTPYGESIPGPAANPNDEGFTGHIQDTDTGLTYMQARYYDPVIGRFLSNDPVGFAEGGTAYFNRYAYTANDPINAIDPDGNETLFLGGAGVQGDYINSFKRSFENAGIKNVRAPNGGGQSTGRLLGDVLAVTGVNDTEFAGSLTGSSVFQAEAARSLTLGDEQYNVAGYSYGSAVAAAGALAIANNGGQVDNLILIGAPINADLMNAVQNSPGISNVINVDLGSQGDPIRAGMSDLQIMGTLPTLMSQMPNHSGHFFFSGSGPEHDARRDQLAKDLVEQGVQ